LKEKSALREIVTSRVGKRTEGEEKDEKWFHRPPREQKNRTGSFQTAGPKTEEKGPGHDFKNLLR